MIGIEEYLHQVAEDFCKYLGEAPELCSLKSVNFDGKAFPDYSDIHIQQYYLLRYAYSYAFEYYTIFKRILQSVYDSHDMRISSIGCGNGIDYWGAAYAVDEMRRNDLKIYYRGNDKIDWRYRIEKRKEDDVVFINKGIDECMRSARCLVSNIYMFPKSISELSENSLKIIELSFREKRIVYDDIMLIFSIRSNANTLNSDVKRSERIVKSVLYNGFQITENVGVESYGIDAAIKSENRNFHYPQNIYDKIIPILNTVCKKYMTNGRNCEDDCEPKLTRKPIMRTNHIRYRVIKFRRSV